MNYNNKPDGVPDHYERYVCEECGNVIWTAPRVEDSDVGVFCYECGETIAGGNNNKK